MFVMPERANQQSGWDAVSLAHTNSYGKEVVVHVQKKSTWLYPYFYPCPIFATGKHVNHRDKYGLETATNLQSLHFHGPEKAIKLAKK